MKDRTLRTPITDLQNSIEMYNKSSSVDDRIQPWK